MHALNERAYSFGAEKVSWALAMLAPGSFRNASLAALLPKQ
jgi:hypothetical protein